MREGLKEIVEGQDGMHVNGEADNGQTTIREVRKTKPDVVIMDIGMPHLNGIEATREILHDNPDAKVLALSMHSEQRHIRQTLRQRQNRSFSTFRSAALEERRKNDSVPIIL